MQLQHLGKARWPLSLLQYLEEQELRRTCHTMRWLGLLVPFVSRRPLIPTLCSRVFPGTCPPVLGSSPLSFPICVESLILVVIHRRDARPLRLDCRRRYVALSTTSSQHAQANRHSLTRMIGLSSLRSGRMRRRSRRSRSRVRRLTSHKSAGMELTLATAIPNCSDFVIKKEDHTIGNLVAEHAKMHRNVLMAGYKSMSSWPLVCTAHLVIMRLTWQ